MLRVRRDREDRKLESTIALINVVFLMLIFFLIAGSLAPPLDRQVALAETRDETPIAPPDALAVRSDGSLWYRGRAVDIEAYLMEKPVTEDGDGIVRVVADRDLPAIELVAIVKRLRQAGAERVRVVTERARSS